MRIKTITIIGPGLCAMLMVQGCGQHSSAGRFEVAADDGTPPSGMVLIEGGAISGNNLTMDERYDEGEYHPATYNITVDDFLMDKYLVTKGLWDDVRNDSATIQRGYTDLPLGGGQGVDHPVHTVSWFDAVKWLNARSERAGREPAYYLDAAYTQLFRSGSGGSQHGYWEVYVKSTANGYRLPTMDEWEYAAAVGATTPATARLRTAATPPGHRQRPPWLPVCAAPRPRRRSLMGARRASRSEPFDSAQGEPGDRLIV